MIKNIDKPALSALWPNKFGMNVVLDLGANIECSEKNLIDFSLMGSALHKSLYPNEDPKVALLNIGSEEIKGNSVIKKTYKELSEKQNSFSRQQWNCERCSSAVGARLLQVKKFPRKITYLSKMYFQLPFDLFQRASASVHVRM